MRVGIVGSRGFVGASLARKLSFEPRVTCVEFENDFDICDRSTWRGGRDLDCVVIASGKMDGDSDLLNRVNYIGVRDFSEYCSEQGVKRLLLLSTGAVYGEREGCTSPSTPLNPQSPYAISKLNGEDSVIKIWAGREYSILRLYFPFGPRQKAPRLIPRIRDAIVRNNPVVCRIDGGPYLTLTHIDDVVDVIKTDFILGFRAGVYNLASTNRYGIFDIANNIGLVLGRDPVFDFSGQGVNVCSEPYSNVLKWKEFDAQEFK